MDSLTGVVSVARWFRARTPFIRYLLFASIAVFFLLYQFSPFFDTAASISKAQNSYEYKTAKLEAEKSIHKGEKKEVLTLYPASDLVEVRLHFVVFGGDPVVEAGPVVSEIRLRIDNLILFIGAFSLVPIVATTLLDSRRIRIGGVAVTVKERKPKGDTTRAAPTPIESFARDVLAASERTDAIFGRSTLLLAGGIVMAFIGVSIFYVTLPETQKDQPIIAYLPHAVRPTGVLVFIEAISWFLLRQYRAQVEDYKWFYRLYLKRANFLAAMRILDKATVRETDIFIAACLVQEDLSGRLKHGESTEGLEAIRIPENSPVTEILRTVSAAFRGSVDKAKSKIEEHKGQETS
jgi:hypothetical protein